MYPAGPDRTVVEYDWLYLPEVVSSGPDPPRPTLRPRGYRARYVNASAAPST
jgi:hypothetical protein